jgi:hypothetical protein
MGGEWSASRPGRGLATGKGPPVPIAQEAGGPQNRPGQRGYRKNPFPLPVIEHRSAGRPARSQRLYCMS